MPNIHDPKPGDVFQLPAASDRKKTPDLDAYRPFTRSDALAIDYPFGHVPALYITLDGAPVRNVRMNGKVRTWKRDPQRVEIPLKYGMYECATATANDDGVIYTPSGALVLVAVG